VGAGPPAGQGWAKQFVKSAKMTRVFVSSAVAPITPDRPKKALIDMDKSDQSLVALSCTMAINVSKGKSLTA